MERLYFLLYFLTVNYAPPHTQELPAVPAIAGPSEKEQKQDQACCEMGCVQMSYSFIVRMEGFNIYATVFFQQFQNCSRITIRFFVRVVVAHKQCRSRCRCKY